MVGPALAGVVIALGSYTLGFALNAASFFAVIVALLFVRLPPPRPTATTAASGTHQGRGTRPRSREPGCRMAILLIGVTAFLLSPFIALVPAVALKLFDNEKTGTSVLITAQGIGAVAGALALAPLAARYGRRRVLVVNLLVLPGLLALYAAAPTLWLAAIAIFAVGAGLHRHPLRADDRRAAPRARRAARPGAQPVHGGAGHRLPDRRGRAGRAGRPDRPARHHHRLRRPCSSCSSPRSWCARPA